MKQLSVKPLMQFSILLFIVFASSCDNSPGVDCFNDREPKSLDSCNFTSFMYDDFFIKILDKDSLPYIIDAKEFKPRDLYDKDSVPLFVFHEESYYHPISIAQYSFEIFALHYSSGDSAHLSYLKTLSQKLIEEADFIDSAIYSLIISISHFINVPMKRYLAHGILPWPRARFYHCFADYMKQPTIPISSLTAT